ncbi:MAG: type II toxin-antitoxin system VapC family toxin [Intrasporangium sp.]|uniref:type II toxin-antitoxin system VapC family toxin n=1 Tax=Intrasporangium sp. TaxID=1925024 RepID=UPI002647DD19|nr:type II toxin-antitoxin system VapC family toxin [Intrasporangium sp.]MDN5797910.1 type II toxin-antitoxin system VapC family toxin [Intrasporangium sp.]
MILVDTSVWIDHLHRAEPGLVRFLDDALVATHPMVIGELALGSMRRRREVIGLLSALPHVVTATHEECLTLVESQDLPGRGLSLVDAHLLASARLTPDARIWTRDKRLAAAASDLSLSWAGP